jgi:hypothetical protein
MIYNILNGDALAYSFPDAGIEGEIIVVREALIDGELTGNKLEDFWQIRARVLETTAADYQNKVVNEFEKLINAPDNSVFNLWFEYDLFCQVNMWFVFTILHDLHGRKNVYAVHTIHADRSDKQFWNGFSRADAIQLQSCFAARMPLSDDDLQLGKNLWTAYKANDLTKLMQLSNNQSSAFPYLKEVITAHVERFPQDGSTGRPEKVIEDITKNISTDFHAVLEEFWKRESIYGFGDSQVKVLYDKVMQGHQ